VPAADLQPLDLKPGEMVRVRSASEIFATLDENGMLDGLPFMPEMLKHCGRTLPVTQRADATCAGDGLVRIMPDTVHLRTIRCDGSFHDGCQAACLMYWKEAWLERAGDAGEAQPRELDEREQAFVDETLIPATRVEREDGSGPDLYRCQATEIKQASSPLGVRELDQYARSLRNWKFPKLVIGLVAEAVNEFLRIYRNRMPERLWILRGERFPFVLGKHEKGKTPKGEPLDLKAGDLVRIKSKREIVATLDKNNRNRGLYFDHEMARFCGRTARVQSRVTHLIEEKNGEMVEIKSDCIILEGVVCPGDFHRLCTRAIYSYWRESWLERIDAPEDHVPTAPCVVTRWSRDPGACSTRQSSSQRPSNK
jgi:predicted DNA-binding antitoxin AbrB/MazE fold protein